MKQSVVKELSTVELKEKLIGEKSSYFRLKSSHAVSPIENPMKIRASRRTIARLETELKSRKDV